MSSIQMLRTVLVTCSQHDITAKNVFALHIFLSVNLHNKPFVCFTLIMSGTPTSSVTSHAFNICELSET